MAKETAVQAICFQGMWKEQEGVSYNPPEMSRTECTDRNTARNSETHY